MRRGCEGWAARSGAERERERWEGRGRRSEGGARPCRELTEGACGARARSAEGARGRLPAGGSGEKGGANPGAAQRYERRWGGERPGERGGQRGTRRRPRPPSRCPSEGSSRSACSPLRRTIPAAIGARPGLFVTQRHVSGSSVRAARSRAGGLAASSAARGSMTEVKAKEPRAPSSARDGAVLLQAPPSRGEAEGIDVALDGLLYPRTSDEGEEGEEKEEEPQQREEEEDREDRDCPSYRLGGGSLSKDCLDSVLDTFLAPAAHATPWSLFGPEVPDVPVAPMSRGPEQKAVDAAPAAPGPSQPRPGAPLWPGADTLSVAVKARPGAEGPSEGRAPGLPGAEERGFPERDAGPGEGGLAPAATASPVAVEPGAGQDYLHVPILPLNSAFLASRTRQLLDVEAAYEGSAFGPRSSPSAPAADLSEYGYPPPDGKEGPFAYGDFQSALKIKEEGVGLPAAPPSFLGAKVAPADFSQPPRAAQEPSLECVLYKAEPPLLPGAYGPPAAPDSLPSTSAAPPGLYSPLGLNGHHQALGFPAAVLKEGLPQLCPPYLGYVR